MSGIKMEAWKTCHTVSESAVDVQINSVSKRVGTARIFGLDSRLA